MEQKKIEPQRPLSGGGEHTIGKKMLSVRNVFDEEVDCYTFVCGSLPLQEPHTWGSGGYFCLWSWFSLVINTLNSVHALVVILST